MGDLRKEDIERFYQDFEKLNLITPVATIAEAVKMSKGSVSKYLNKKLDPSENFLNKFYEKFYNTGFNKVSRETTQEGSKDIGSGINQEKSDNKKYVELLERDRNLLEQMQEIIKTNLTELLLAQRLNRAQLTVLTDLGSKTLATVQKRNLEMVREETSKALNDIVVLQQQAGNAANK